MAMRRIDYAAQAVYTAIVEKFGRQHDLSDLKVEGLDDLIHVTMGDRDTVGTRDDLMTLIRQASEPNDLWPPSSR